MNEPVVLSKPLSGGCLCGAVRYRVEAGPADSAFCHCRMCQRASGAPVMAWITVTKERFRYRAGQPAAYRSSAKVAREFCGRCGTQILFRDDRDASLDVSTASLDEPELIPPRYHIWHESHIEWFETADPWPRFAQRNNSQ